nr:hypothetical protein [Tanacetum cinerariifolium]
TVLSALRRSGIENEHPVKEANLSPLNFGNAFDDDMKEALMLFFWVSNSLVMAAPTIPVSAEENLKDPIDIRVEIIHLDPVTAVAFPAAAIEELTALRFRVDIAETENTSLCAKIKTTKAIEKITRNRECNAPLRKEDVMS